MSWKRNIYASISSTNWKRVLLGFLPIGIFLLLTTVAPGIAPPPGGGTGGGGPGPGP